MKATGIVRRIDELGRIVIPKEIRRTFRIKEGTPLEIFSGNEGELMLKKYSPMMSLKDYAEECAQSINAVLDKLVLICDSETFIAGAGAGKKDFLNKPVSDELNKLLEARKSVILTKKENNLIKTYIQNQENTQEALSQNTQVLSSIVSPILSDGFAFGAIIVMSLAEDLILSDLKLIKAMSLFLSKQII